MSPSFETVQGGGALRGMLLRSLIVAETTRTVATFQAQMSNLTGSDGCSKAIERRIPREYILRKSRGSSDTVRLLIQHDKR